MASLAEREGLRGQVQCINFDPPCLPRPRVEVPCPQGIKATFDWQAAVDPALGRMCAVTLVNERETYR